MQMLVTEPNVTVLCTVSECNVEEKVGGKGRL
jgi:hypothetical protein